jgi:hypothetical protein
MDALFREELKMNQNELGMGVPIIGTWPWGDCPDAVLIHDRLFRKARWQQPYAGVVEQYREAVARNSAHMKVYADGTWVIDHVDQDNPDMGRPVEHFLNDHPLGKFAKVAALVGGAFVVGGALAHALSD